MKVLSIPHLSHFRSEESGIKRVVEAYFKYLPDYDIELVEPESTTYDIKVVHAGMTGSDCDVAHLHGIYWTADYDAPRWEYDANRRIVEAVRQAKEVTVPSAWVAETFQRDMRFTPHIIPHGIDWQDWQHDYENQGYVLWNKNRMGDVCDPTAISRLAKIFTDTQFVTTFANEKLDNILSLDGIIPHDEMKRAVQQAGVYLSTTKETFCIGALEAMAAGVPVLGWAFGGNLQLIEHGVNGYLAEPHDYDDLIEGLNYCLKYGKVLGENGKELAKQWTWQDACEKVAGVYRLAMEDKPATVSVVIPVYNKPVDEVKRAIKSCLDQTLQPDKIIIIDDGSENTDEIESLVWSAKTHNDFIIYSKQNNQGVANARNNGIAQSNSKYICCLDADDWLEPTFLETCVNALEDDNSLGIAYTSLHFYKPDGENGVSQWPTDWDYDKHLVKQNQVPTCCVFRRKMWERLGGYRQRYAPQGAGSEDAEYFLRAGAYGFKGEKVTEEALFNYSWMSGQVTGNPDYQEVDWLSWQPWVKDGLHPFASYATPFNKMSHPVRQYDEPIVSVVIPVGPGHEKSVIDALDSLEAQTFRKWEAIIAWDSDFTIGTLGYPEDSKVKSLKDSYPYIKLIYSEKKGAGHARNRGAEIARAPFLLFLDADDTLHPQALSKMLNYWNEYQMAIYPDYVGQAYISPELALKLDGEKRLESYDQSTGEAIITYTGDSYEFDCNKALRQPDNLNNTYIWNLITTLIPKQWHFDIGGFDESMDTWEDWDYWLRQAKNGRCFKRLEEMLVRYRFYTGGRRDKAAPDTEDGRQKAHDVLEYMRKKHEEIESVAGCGCGKKSKNGSNASVVKEAAGNSMSDDDFVQARYLGSRGNHHIVGAFQFDTDPGLPSRKRSIGKEIKYVLYYGYKGSGYECLVHKMDTALMVGKWEVIPELQKPEVERKETLSPIPVTEAVSPLERLQQVRERVKQEAAILEFNLDNLAAVSPIVRKRMKEAGLNTPHTIKQAGKKGLVEIKGIGKTRAEAILRELD